MAGASCYGFCSVASLRWRSAFSWMAHVFKTWLFGGLDNCRLLLLRRDCAGRIADSRLIPEPVVQFAHGE
ncbi:MULTISPECIES: DUF1010 domain-containing protein [unclassified Acidovorax]|uniref:DUF1010 domain-containing protein n=1 Tax=unclassified Acidovorax TaxID=2684926 RepID=UPI00138EF52C